MSRNDQNGTLYRGGVGHNCGWEAKRAVSGTSDLLHSNSQRRVHWGLAYDSLWRQPVDLLARLSEPTRSSQPIRGFYVRPFDGLVTRIAAGHHYRGNWGTSSLTGPSRVRTPTSKAATALLDLCPYQSTWKNPHKNSRSSPTVAPPIIPVIQSPCRMVNCRTAFFLPLPSE